MAHTSTAECAAASLHLQAHTDLAVARGRLIEVARQQASAQAVAEERIGVLSAETTEARDEAAALLAALLKAKEEAAELDSARQAESQASAEAAAARAELAARRAEVSEVRRKLQQRSGGRHGGADDGAGKIESALLAASERERAAHQAIALRAEIHEMRRQAEKIKTDCDAREYHNELLDDELKLLRSGSINRCEVEYNALELKPDTVNNPCDASLSSASIPSNMCANRTCDPTAGQFSVSTADDATIGDARINHAEHASRSDIDLLLSTSSYRSVGHSPAFTMNSVFPATDCATMKESSANSQIRLLSAPNCSLYGVCSQSSDALHAPVNTVVEHPAALPVAVRGASVSDVFASNYVDPPASNINTVPLLATPPRRGQMTPDDKCCTGSPWPADSKSLGALLTSDARLPELQVGREDDQQSLPPSLLLDPSTASSTTWLSAQTSLLGDQAHLGGTSYSTLTKEWPEAMPHLRRFNSEIVSDNANHSLLSGASQFQRDTYCSPVAQHAVQRDVESNIGLSNVYPSACPSPQNSNSSCCSSSCCQSCLRRNENADAHLGKVFDVGAPFDSLGGSSTPTINFEGSCPAQRVCSQKRQRPSIRSKGCDQVTDASGDTVETSADIVGGYYSGMRREHPAEPARQSIHPVVLDIDPRRDKMLEEVAHLKDELRCMSETCSAATVEAAQESSIARANQRDFELRLEATKDAAAACQLEEVSHLKGELRCMSEKCSAMAVDVEEEFRAAKAIQHDFQLKLEAAKEPVDDNHVEEVAHLKGELRCMSETCFAMAADLAQESQAAKASNEQIQIREREHSLSMAAMLAQLEEAAAVNLGQTAEADGEAAAEMRALEDQNKLLRAELATEMAALHFTQSLERAERLKAEKNADHSHKRLVEAEESEDVYMSRCRILEDELAAFHAQSANFGPTASTLRSPLAAAAARAITTSTVGMQPPVSFSSDSATLSRSPPAAAWRRCFSPVGAGNSGSTPLRLLPGQDNNVGHMDLPVLPSPSPAPRTVAAAGAAASSSVAAEAAARRRRVLHSGSGVLRTPVAIPRRGRRCGASDEDVAESNLDKEREGRVCELQELASMDKTDATVDDKQVGEAIAGLGADADDMVADAAVASKAMWTMLAKTVVAAPRQLPFATATTMIHSDSDSESGASSVERPSRRLSVAKAAANKVCADSDSDSDVSSLERLVMEGNPLFPRWKH